MFLVLPCDRKVPPKELDYGLFIYNVGWKVVGIIKQTTQDIILLLQFHWNQPV